MPVLDGCSSLSLPCSSSISEGTGDSEESDDRSEESSSEGIFEELADWTMVQDEREASAWGS